MPKTSPDTPDPTDPRSTPARLLSAAVEMIAREGWGAVTTRGVAERAGVQPGLVHYHFESVDALKQAAVKTALEMELDRAIGPMADRTPGEILRASAAAIQEMEHDPALSMLLIEALPPAARDAAMRDEVAELLGRFRHRLAERIRACHPQPAASPEMLAGLFAAVLDGLALHALAVTDIDVEASIEPMLTLLGPERTRGPS